MTPAQLKRSMTIRYALGLSLVAIVITSAYFLQSHTLNEKKNAAHIINISGMQRMLSQRIALMAREAYHAQSETEVAIYIKKMQHVTDLMQRNHIEILQHIGKYKPSSPYRQKMDVLHKTPSGIDERVGNYLGFAQQFISVYEQDGSAGIKDSSDLMLNIVAIARNGLLRQLNDAVSEHEAYAKNRIRKIRTFELIILITGLSLLVLEVIFIFVPMVRRVVNYSQALEQSNAELIEFSYRVSHDLRAPIVSSRGLVDVVLSLVDQEANREAHKALGFIRKSLVKLESLIQDIVNMTRMKLQEETTEDVNLVTMIESAIESLQSLDNRQKVEVSYTLDGDPNIHIKRIYLQQILENFLSNGIKYHDAGKSSPYVRLHATVDHEICTIRIEDNGIGIPEEYHDQLFTMFKRFHPKHSFGSGLGLYLVAQNASALSGNVHYEKHDDGSAFVIQFPAAQSNT